MRGLNKRGLSPVVASVLLVALVLVLASIVFLWARGFIGEQIEKGDKPVAELCDELDFSIELILAQGGVSGTYDVEIVNRGNYAIFGFLVVKSLDGDESREELAISVNPQDSRKKYVDLRIDLKKPDKVKFYPSLLGSLVGESSNRPYSCLDKGLEKTL